MPSSLPPSPLQLVRGVPTLVSVVGGSNTVGHGAHNGFPWPRYLYEWLKDAFPKTDITVSGYAGTPPPPSHHNYPGLVTQIDCCRIALSDAIPLT